MAIILYDSVETLNIELITNKRFTAISFPKVFSKSSILNSLELYRMWTFFTVCTV